jgi:hypothetical protein
MCAKGPGDEPKPITLKEFKKVYLSLRGDITEGTRVEHARALKYLAEHFGGGQLINKIRPLDARQYISWYRKRKHRDRRPGAGDRQQDGTRMPSHLPRGDGMLTGPFEPV